MKNSKQRTTLGNVLIHNIHNISIGSNCSLSNSNMKTKEYLLFECSVTKQVLYGLDLYLNIN